MPIIWFNKYKPIKYRIIIIYEEMAQNPSFFKRTIHNDGTFLLRIKFADDGQWCAHLDCCEPNWI